jgi:hypothetical protein
MFSSSSSKSGERKTNFGHRCGQFHQHFMSAFAPIFLRQKSTNPKSKYKKVLRKTFVRNQPLVYSHCQDIKLGYNELNRELKSRK